MCVLPLSLSQKHDIFWGGFFFFFFRISSYSTSKFLLSTQDISQLVHVLSSFFTPCQT